ncbi:MAG TPA: hypothetical protein VL970_03315 [Candidatus Acidoferrales bacterium]|nr:hypothetical protein [Candidatus Acidoferrales bacterium]
MRKTIVLSLVCLAALISAARAQIYDTNNDTVQTFAGYGIPAYVDGQGEFSAFSAPSQIVSDTASNLYVWDSANARIRKISPSAAVSTLAGGGPQFEGYGTNVSLSWAAGGALAIDHADKLWFVMGNGYYGASDYLLSITTNGLVTLENGGLTNLSTASGLCVDSANRLYYSGGNRVYRYDPITQNLEAYAGSGIAGNFDGQGTVFTAFSTPAALACDRADNIYVWDSGNGTIRRVDQNENVATIAGNGYSYFSSDGTGTNATFGYSSVASMFGDNAGNIYFVGGGSVRKMDAQTNVVTLAGAFSLSGFLNGPGNLARFNNPAGGCFSQGMVLIADTGNNRIRDITFNSNPQVVPPAQLQIQTFAGLEITGTLGRTYQVQTSPDMNNWTTAATLLLTSSPYLWVDTNPVGGNKFYRAVLLP